MIQITPQRSKNMINTHQQNKREITRLTKIWYEYVSNDHHKDRDCHFYISKTWSYGNKPKYIVEHFGYIGEECNIECNSFQKAHKILLEQLVKMIKQEQEWAKTVKKNPDEWDSLQNKQAEYILGVKL